MSIEIRPSTVSSMMLCPARTMLREANEPYQPAEALVFGSVVHARIEHNLTSTAEVSVSGLLRQVWADDTDGSDVDDYISEVRKAQLVYEVVVAYDKWLQQVKPFLPQSEAIVERKFRSTIGMHPVSNEAVEMFGTPDVVYPDEGLIVDWKTAGRGWDKRKMQAQMQPMAYNVLVADGLGYNDVFGFTFYVYDRQKEAWKKHDYGKPSQDAIDAFIQQAFGMALLSEGEPIFTPGGQGNTARGWHCDPRYCDRWGVCPGKYLINDVKAKQREKRLHEKGWS